MGMFAGDRNFSKGEFLADGDLIIPSYDITWHVGHKDYQFLWIGTYYGRSILKLRYCIHIFLLFVLLCGS
jgi:hypothetical protein